MRLVKATIYCFKKMLIHLIIVQLESKYIVTYNSKIKTFIYIWKVIHISGTKKSKEDYFGTGNIS